MSRHVLVVAFHFPPAKGSSGIQRTLKFCTYLRDHGWSPIVLTVAPSAHEMVSAEQLSEIPDHVHVERAFGFDTAKVLSLKGRYLRLTAQPDRWVSWWPAGVWNGLEMIRRFRPEVIFSTFPIATAHLIALTLHRLSGLPWVADFRDSMTEDNWPRDPLTRRIHRTLEAATLKRCARAVFTTPGAIAMYRGRYPGLSSTHFALVENGFDEENFLDAEAGLFPGTRDISLPLKMVHSGLLYPEDRDPRPFFEALSRLRVAGEIGPSNLQVVLRAPGSERYFGTLLESFQISDVVRIEGAVGYREALQEMMAADALLLFQGPTCNHQIPAKLYEYFRAGRPIFALTDPQGDTAAVLRSARIDDIVDISDADAISHALRRFLSGLRDTDRRGVDRTTAAAYSRRSRTAELARVLDDVTKGDR